ncbi:nuclear transcription factor Y subunit A-3 isoform X2 [Ricinus communis]|uniref:Nuclear transcription factor Y subunit n=1 Tax=Ricinus communis TaxID=3988 RepID=B9RK30_RICCO|nr:nuclear transcription factor Y subunit A-3 isoform X2 [Ricinus communis]XP_015571750.1 nuclear transcription factor Y subunit A-3 isoform X2 [Ricinus communis]XP_015571751.1 nuclear transcription factor Y subunit A-3 isoform X2 [Ricinus communis]XP_025012236.1 nuclear transcription factor Y subunit A-3 isoform X2 [Ricinus communis]EEF48028.1 Nuclear transcription factor Y subunit A-3, putative [Ricinus communis]|eukprot:XP_002514074.1 nuclear transcription factor Y subunit A-3 isoform X2 [Ricinus communis]
MAVRIQNLPKKNYGQVHFTFSCPSWWNSNEQQSPRFLSKNISFKVESTPQLNREAKHLGLQHLDQDSSSAQSVGQSHNEVGAVGGTSSEDQCISSESGEDESCGKNAEGRMKPVLLFSAPEISRNPSQTDNSRSMAHAPVPYADHYFGELFTPYGPKDIMGSQILGMTAARVALPLDLADDGPIYVNAKQYHGILRRRQSRAKLEARNKLVKARKPYLHESRHLHALNRVRGSGGRFLSKNKVQQLDANATSSRQGVSDSILHLHSKNETSQLENCPYSRTLKSCTDVTSVSNGDAIYRQQDHWFSGTAVRFGGGMQTSGGHMYSGT